MAGPTVFLIVEKGEPHEAGKRIALSEERDVILGRSSDNWQPDISFGSLCVSRRHALIGAKEGRYYVTDLSKHGTAVNGTPIEHNRPRALMNGDRISLAGETVVVVFHNPPETGCDETVELNQAMVPATNFDSPEKSAGLQVNARRREAFIDGNPVYLAGKDIELLMFLYHNRGKAVSYNEIKRTIWPERVIDPVTGAPDVGSDEIKALIYRLRKRLGPYGKLVTAVPRYGYMLDL